MKERPTESIEGATGNRSEGETLAAISNAMVWLQKEFGGKGPEKTKSYWAGPDMLITVMRGGYTAAEETMYQAGQGLAVRDSRHAFQDVMEQRMKDVIWGLTGREVAAL